MSNIKKKRLGRGLEALLSVSGSSHDDTYLSPQAPESLSDILEADPGNLSSAPKTSTNETSESPGGVTTSIASTPSSFYNPAVSHSPNTEDDDPATEMRRLDVFQIDDNPFQPRRVFSESEIASLSESLKDHDLLQPILVREINGRYQLISGERRLRAAIQAGWKTIPARIRQADDRLVAELAIVENLQRKDLNPLEKALSFKRYLAEHQSTQEELAQRLKIDRSTIANLMRLLELPQLIQDSVSDGKITAGHARALLPLGEEQEQISFANRIVREGWNVRDTERRVSERISDLDNSSISKPKKKLNPQVEMLEQRARMSLGTKVEIKTTSKGSGKMVLHFKNQKEFERIFEQLCQEQGVLQKVA